LKEGREHTGLIKGEGRGKPRLLPLSPEEEGKKREGREGRIISSIPPGPGGGGGLLKFLPKKRGGGRGKVIPLQKKKEGPDTVFGHSFLEGGGKGRENLLSLFLRGKGNGITEDWLSSINDIIGGEKAMSLRLVLRGGKKGKGQL